MPPRPSRPMIRKRSARIAPGVKPPASIESEEASRPTFEELPGRCAFCATEGDAMFVGSCETDDTASPHAGQKCAPAGTSPAHAGQRVTVNESYRCVPLEREVPDVLERL